VDVHERFSFELFEILVAQMAKSKAEGETIECLRQFSEFVIYAD